MVASESRSPAPLLERCRHTVSCDLVTTLPPVSSHMTTLPLVSQRGHFFERDAFSGEAGHWSFTQGASHSAERQKKTTGRKRPIQINERMGVMRGLNGTGPTGATCLTFSFVHCAKTLSMLCRVHEKGFCVVHWPRNRLERLLERQLTGAVCCHMDDVFSVRELSRVHRDCLFSLLGSHGEFLFLTLGRQYFLSRDVRSTSRALTCKR